MARFGGDGRAAPCARAVLACARAVGAACGSVDAPGDDASAVDAAAPDAAPAADAAPGLPPFGKPELVTELVGADGIEQDPALTADQREIFFSSNRMGGLGAGDVWTARREVASDPWGMPTVVLELSSTADETHPNVSANGLVMYLASDRPGGPGKRDIYVSARATRQAAWSPPTLVDELNSAGDDASAAMAPGSQRLVLSSLRGGSQTDLYLSKRDADTDVWSIPQPVVELNTNDIENSGFLAGGGRALYFTHNGADGAAIHLAVRDDDDGTFDPAAPALGEHAGMGDSDPWVSEDQRTIVFSSTRDGVTHLYRATR